jgi:hypothetical protein
MVKFAQPLKEKTHALYGRSELHQDAFEYTKDKPSPVFLGLTPREAYIGVSERLMKPLHGVDIFGKLLLNKMLHDRAEGYVISDSGFAPEALPIIESFGRDNCILVRIHAEERGCSFKSDSRSYIELPVAGTVDVLNDNDKAKFLNQATHAINDVLHQMIGGR